MSKKAEQTISERAVEAEAKHSELPSELGLSNDEFEVVQAFATLIEDRVIAAPVEPFIAEAETHIRKKFPNNEAAIDAVCEFNIDAKSLEFVERYSLGSAVGNLRRPPKLDEAKIQLAKASTRIVASPADQDRQVQYAKSIRWLAQMKVQAEYKLALEPLFHAVYRIQTGMLYNAPDQTVDAVPADDTLNLLTA